LDQTTTRRSRGRPRKHASDGETGTVQALDRGLQLLSLLSKEHRVTLSHLAMQAGMAPSTAHRLLMTLQSHQFAEFDENTQEWMIGVESYRVGSGFLRRVNLVDASRDIMHRLMAETGETANLAIADNGDVIFLSQVETNHPIRAFFRPGTRGAMHASGAGKALLAQLTPRDLEQLLQQKGLQAFTARTLSRPEDLMEDLARSRERGWAFDDEERYAGMRCIAAPVFNARGEAVAGISISGPAARFDNNNVARLGIVVRDAAAELSLRIGGVPPTPA